MLFRVIFDKLKDRCGEQISYLLVFSPIILIYVFLIRPTLVNASILSNFVWLMDCIVFGVPLGFAIAVTIGKKVGKSFGDTIFYPRQFLKVPPDILSPIKGLIARGEYAEAHDRLNALLEEKPFSPEPYLLLVELYADGLNDYLRTMELIEEYFSRGKIYPFEENIDMLLLYADLCQEHHYLHQAEKLLEQEIRRKGYLELKRKRLQTRLEAIRAQSDFSSLKI